MAEPDHEVVKHFIDVTELDGEMAVYFLKEADNNLQRAIDMFYDSQSVIVIEDSDITDITLPSAGAPMQEDPDASVVILDESGTAEPEAVATPSIPAPSLTLSLKLICWNIQGLEERHLKERTMAAINVLREESPDIIFLQEVIPSTHALMVEHLCSTYHIFPGSRSEYFASMLLKKAEFQVQSVLMEPFPGSRMLRNLIIAKARFHGRNMKFMTSHIESMAANTAERHSQLSTTFEHMRNADEEISIFGADTNAKDFEIDSLRGEMTGIHDVWEALGSTPETRFTWDMSQNDNLGFRGPRIRYDRLFYHQKEECLRPIEMRLIGKGRLPCGMFISDHWGLMTKFNLRETASVT